MIVFSTNGTGSTRYPNGEKINLYLTPYTQIKLKWIIYLNLKAKVIKFLEEYIKENLCDLDFLRQNTLIIIETMLSWTSWK